MTGRGSREVVGGNDGLDDVISVAERFTTSSKYVLTLDCQLITYFASLVQLAEHSTCNRDVVGSIPATSIWVRVSIIPDVTNER